MYNNENQQQSLHNEIIESMWAAAYEWLAAFETEKAKKQEEKKNV